MSTGEVVALGILAALLGACLGAVLSAMGASHRRHVAQRRVQQLEAYAAWLAACLTVSRASLSFVAAFRALAEEDRGSAYFDLRKDEAQRARASWVDALRELDRAEAMLIAWAAADPRNVVFREYERVRPDVLRSVIDGDRPDVDRLAQTLRRSDQAAVALVQAAAGRLMPTQRHWLVHRFFAILERLGEVINGWGARQ